MGQLGYLFRTPWEPPQENDLGPAVQVQQSSVDETVSAAIEAVAYIERRVFERHRLRT